MTTEVLMPVLTQAGEDGVVTAWLVDEGQFCDAGQLIAEIQVEKVAEQVYAPAAGRVSELAPINSPVEQGQPICQIVGAEEAAESESPRDVTPPAETSGRPPRAPASPAARRLARELGVDLGEVAGTGPGGRITESDVRALAGGGPGEGMTGLRAVIARNMRDSHLETAPVTLTTSVDLDEVPEHITATAIKAVAVALGEHPGLNGTRTGDVFATSPAVNVAVAVQTDEGLVSPVIRDPQDRDVAEIHEEIRELAERARARQLAMTDYQGGTFTVTNLGSYGVDAFTPIINLPQIAVLGIGALRRVPVLDADGSLSQSHRLALSLTFDHAFVDGAPAAAFLRRVGELLGSVT